MFALQSVIFHVERHPKHTWFTQCVTFNFFPTPVHELAYNLFNVIAVYALPLLIISVAYSLILCEISKKSKQSRSEYCLFVKLVFCFKQTLFVFFVCLFFVFFLGGGGGGLEFNVFIPRAKTNFRLIRIGRVGAMGILKYKVTITSIHNVKQI